MADTPEALVKRAVAAYEHAHRSYREAHGEIFNPVEQSRLRASLSRALAACRTSSGPPHLALDLGCGTGNLTDHLLDLGTHVTAADVSPHFLSMVSARFCDDPRVRALQVSGLDLDCVPDESYDVVGAYSVLHHIPDYLAAIEDAVRVLRPGGILYLDHEYNERYWNPDDRLRGFRRAITDAERAGRGVWHPTTRRWQRALLPATHVRRLRLLRNPNYYRDREGDIHTRPDDHIEWDAVIGTAASCGAAVVARDDYLMFKLSYPMHVYQDWSTRCDDMTALTLRKAR